MCSIIGKLIFYCEAETQRNRTSIQEKKGMAADSVAWDQEAKIAAYS